MRYKEVAKSLHPPLVMYITSFHSTMGLPVNAQNIVHIIDHLKMFFGRYIFVTYLQVSFHMIKFSQLFRINFFGFYGMGDGFCFLLYAFFL
jgi:hypothetical protein